MKWYAFKCDYGKENDTCETLSKCVGVVESVSPDELIDARTRRKYFPAYAFARVDNDDVVFPSELGTPSILSVEDVARLIAACNHVPAFKAPYAIGNQVRIEYGPFMGVQGRVDLVNEQKGLVRVTITMLGQAIPIELEYWQVEKL